MIAWLPHKKYGCAHPHAIRLLRQLLGFTCFAASGGILYSVGFSFCCADAGKPTGNSVEKTSKALHIAASGFCAPLFSVDCRRLRSMHLLTLFLGTQRTDSMLRQGVAPGGRRCTIRTRFSAASSPSKLRGQM
jgi:hypothetical protein